MSNYEFPYSLPVWVHTGKNTVQTSAAVSDALPDEVQQDAVLVLVGVTPPAPNGLYLGVGNVWRYVAPFDILNMAVFRGYEVSVYHDLAVDVVPNQTSFVAYRNGVEIYIPSIIRATDKALYTTVRVIDAMLDETGKIPTELLPIATTTSLGAVQIDPDSALSVSPEGVLSVDSSKLDKVNYDLSVSLPFAPAKDEVVFYQNLPADGTYFGGTAICEGSSPTSVVFTVTLDGVVVGTISFTDGLGTVSLTLTAVAADQALAVTLSTDVPQAVTKFAFNLVFKRN